MKAAKTAVPIDHHADANLKRMQPPMTSFFSPFAALTASRCDQGTDTQSQKKLAPSVLQEKPTKIVATFRKRPRLLLKGTKGDNLPITNAAFKERGIDIQTVLSIAEHQASLYSSEEEDSLCLSHLVMSVKPKKEKKRKNLKDVSAMENRIRAKSAHAVSTESTNLLEEPVSVMKGTLPMLNDFGVWKALVGRSDHFTKCTRSVKHVAKQRVLKDPPYRNILKTETDHNKQSKRKKDELKKKPLPAEDLEKLICELPLEGFAERNKMEPNAYFPSLDGVPKGLEREKKCADAARPRKAHLGFSRNIAQALLDRSIYGRTAKLRPAIVTTEHQAESVNGNETTDENELVYNNESSQYNEMVDNSNEVKLSRTRIPWSHPSWLSLVQHSGSGSGKCTVTKMAWDRLGVLLAVAYEGSAVSSGNPVVAIYDWDMVAAADRRGRSHRQRQLCEECADVKEVAVEQVEPFMTIPIPSTSRTPVILLEWNPFRPDELVVGLRFVCFLFLIASVIVYVTIVYLTLLCFLVG